MIVVHAWTRARPGAREELDRHRATLAEASRRDAGCLQYDPVARVDDELTVGFVERWTDRAALAAHLRQPHIEAYAAAVRDLVAGPADILVVEGGQVLGVEQVLTS